MSAGSLPLQYSVWCQDAVDDGSKERFLRAAAPYPPALQEIGNSYWEICGDWRPAGATAADRQPVHSDVPTLVMSGAYDHVTIASKAAEIAKGFRNGQFVLYQHASHQVPPTPGLECTFALIRAFLNEPMRKLDTSCVAQLPPIHYVTTVPQ